MRYLANGLTVARMLLSLVLLARAPFSLAVYTAAGVTDMLDGWVARRTGTASDFGARLDSTADILFLLAAARHLLPRWWIALPGWIWELALAAGVLRCGAYGLGAWRQRRFTALHTRLNKLTGAALFCLAYVPSAFLTAAAGLTALLAVWSAGEELILTARAV